jgi:predicted ribosomally synthesized peptide with SipW-like signal peptide
MKNKKLKTLVVAAAFAVCLLIGGISAYFTDADTATNTFTIGKVSIDLKEPKWEEPKDIVPNQEMEKNPQIENDGVNSAYVFMEVVIPYANIIVANEDGSKNAKADTDLFIMLDKDGNEGVNDGWVLVSQTENEDDKTVTYLYAYGTSEVMTELKKDETTPSLFDKVKFVNAIEGQGLEGSTKTIVVNAYAVQMDNLEKEDGSARVTPVDVWEVINNQNPSTVVTEAEDMKTDEKQ